MVQLLYVHGGTTFSTYDEYLEHLKSRPLSLDYSGGSWADKLSENLSVQIITPKMPNKVNAKYDEWKIHFERHLKMMDEDIVLIGWSLGGTFLMRWLSENNSDKNILFCYCISAVYDDVDLGDRHLAGGFECLDNSQQLIQKNCSSIRFFHSKDDDQVPFSHMLYYQELLPEAKFHIFSDRKHFYMPEFPELIQAIQEDLSK